MMNTQKQNDAQKSLKPTPVQKPMDLAQAAKESAETQRRIQNAPLNENKGFNLFR